MVRATKPPRARARARSRSARLTRAFRFSRLSFLLLAFSRPTWRKPSRLDGRAVARGDARAPKRERARPPRTAPRARTSRPPHHASRPSNRSPPPNRAQPRNTRPNLDSRRCPYTDARALFAKCRKNNNRGRIRTASLGARTRSSGTRATRALRGPRLRRGPPRGRTCVRDPTRPPPLPRAGGRRLLLRRRAEARRARSETRISPLRRRCACLSP